MGLAALVAQAGRLPLEQAAAAVRRLPISMEALEAQQAMLAAAHLAVAALAARMALAGQAAMLATWHSAALAVAATVAAATA
jgi:hypothetical protein